MAKKQSGSAGGDAPVRYFKEQFDDEELLLVFRKHPVVMRKGLIFASIGMLLPVLGTTALTVIYANNPERLPSVTFLMMSLLLGFFLALLIMLPHWISWHYSVYIVTNQRLIQITQKGLFKRSMVALGLEQVQMVNYEVDGFMETMLGFGTIVVQSFVGSLTIHNVHHPAKIQKELLHLLRDLGYTTSSMAAQEDAAETTYEA